MEAMNSNDRLDNLQDDARRQQWHEITEGYKQKIARMERTNEKLSKKIEVLDNDLLTLQRKLDGQLTERTAVISLTDTGQVDIVLDGPWRFSDVGIMTKPLRREIRKLGTEQNAEQVEKLKKQEERLIQKDQKRQEQRENQEKRSEQQKQKELNNESRNERTS